ncbi:hypothetical protein FAY30_26390 (plasmid) [Bacillus sp. S3]|uniref:replication-relaxation family protein n=1 Tax=Bacillus sp. S3 TaxID=486398 RepID=UPI0011883F3A|nr:replication-relaxation family protein [Bacillus sp. S3]QCJ45472.1 hypothetical protein FAY30_26390 [Bacillus sp. S3]
MDKKIYNFGKGKSGVWLTERDIELLKLIFDHRILSLKELKYYAESLYSVKHTTLAKKFQRWREEKIVVDKKYGDRTVYYRLTKNGYYILVNEGEIVPGDTHYKELAAPVNQTDHYFGIRDVVVRTLVEVKKLNMEVFSYSPASMPYIEKGNESSSPLIVPDWILTNQFGFLNIEIDTGNENLNAIEAKIDKYVKYATDRPDENHHVLIVIMDNQDKFFRYQKEFGLDRSGRVANVKRAIIGANAHVHSNLHFYVAPMNKAHHMACSILTGQSKLIDELRSSEIEAIQTLLIMNNNFNYEIEQLNANDFYLPEVSNDLYADAHVLLKDGDSEKRKVVLIKLMEEGSCKCLDELNYLNTLRMEKRFKQKVNKIIAIYRSTSEFEYDSLGKPIMQHVVFGVKERLMSDIDSPPFYKNANQFKKGAGILL